MTQRLCKNCGKIWLERRNKSGLCHSCVGCEHLSRSRANPEHEARRLDALRKAMRSPEYRRKCLEARKRRLFCTLDLPARKYYRQLRDKEGWSQADAAELAADDMRMRALERQGVTL